MKKLLLVTLVLLAAAPASASALVIGVADQKADMFTDPAFDEMGVRHARIYVPWDVLDQPQQRAELDAWMRGAREHRVTPLVSFGHSRVRRRSLPSPAVFRRNFLRFRARYPTVTVFATWNEANHCGEPVCHRPERVARYWRDITKACRRCKIAVAELLDSASMVSYARRLRRHTRREPRYWALHNYVEANRFKTDRLRRLLKATKGEMWLTEVGGIVARRNKTRETIRAIPESVPHQERVTNWIFDELVNVHRRITRVYLYHWNVRSIYDTWDSALIGPDGERRPAFWVLERAIRDNGFR
jgi:hypothetical protein